MKLIKKGLSCLLMFSMLLSMLPTGALAAHSDDGTPVESPTGMEYQITKDGVPISAADVAALIAGGASLDDTILVDGTAITLGDFQKMIEIETELDRLDKTYFSQSTEWSPEQQAALLSLWQQLQTSGLTLSGADPTFPSGFDYTAEVTASVSAGTVPNAVGNVTVTYTLNKELARDVSFYVRTVNGSAAAGTHYNTVGRQITIEAGDTSAQVAVNVLSATAWNGQKTFFVEAYDITGALFSDGAPRCSVPVAIASTKEYSTNFEATFTDNRYVIIYPDKNLGNTVLSYRPAVSGTTYNLSKNPTSGAPSFPLTQAQENAWTDGIISHITLRTAPVAAPKMLESFTSPANEVPIVGQYKFRQEANSLTLTLAGEDVYCAGTRVATAGGVTGVIPVETHVNRLDQKLAVAPIRDNPNLHVNAWKDTVFYNSSMVAFHPNLADYFHNYQNYSYPPGNYTVNESAYRGHKDQPVFVTYLDELAPTVTSVTMDESVNYGVGGILPVVVTFSEPVDPQGARAIVNGVTCYPVETGDITKTLTFAYQIRPGDADVTEVTEISGAVDLSGLEMLSDTTGYTLGTVHSKVIHTLADGIRASSLSPDKPQYSATDTTAVLTLTLPENEFLSATIKKDWDIAPESYCPNVFLSIDGGQTLERLYVVGDGALTALSATLSLDSLAEGQSYVAELFAANATLLPGTYAFFACGETVLLTQDDFSIVTPIGFPDKDLYGDDLPDAPSLKLGISVASGDFTWADPTKTTAYGEGGTLPAGDFHFAWRCDNPGVATIDESGQIHLTGLSGTAEFTLTALNGGRATVVSNSTAAVTVRPGHAPFLSVPGSSKTIVGRAQEDVTVYWASNLTEKNNEVAAGHVTAFTVSVYRAQGGVKTGDPIAETTVSSSIEKPISAAVFSGLDLISSGDTPSYVAEIHASTLPDVVGGARTLRAEVAIIIRSQPAVAKLTYPASLYITDKISSLSVDWSLEHFDRQNHAAFKLTVTNNATGTKIIDQQSTAESSGTVAFPVSGGSFRNMYTVELWAKNVEDATWSYDSFVLTVYASDALQIFVEGAAAGDSLTLSNHDWISTLSQDEILALSRDITLEKAVSINYGEKAWSEIRDRIAWSTADTDVAGLSLKQGSFYEDIHTLPYTSYAPAANFLVSGLADGSTTLKAAHALLGDDLSDSVGLNVETLRNHLYLFNFYPAVETTIQYNDGKTAVSNAQGQAAIYEENGIDGTIYVQSVHDGLVYIGTLSAQALTSGENSTVSLELYPVNNFKLHPAASIPLRFVDEENKPLPGNVTIRGGVYRNGAYCPDAIIDNKPVGTGVTEDYIITPDQTGSYTFHFGIDKFITENDTAPVTARDDISFLFEVRADGYYPTLLSVDGNLNARAAIRTGMRVVTLEKMPVSAAGKPFVASQTMYYNDSAQGFGRNIRGLKGKVGISDAYPQASVETVVLWPGTQDTDIDRYMLQIANANGWLAPVQTGEATRYPFSTITVVRHLLPLGKDSLERWGLSNPFSTQQINLRYTAGGTLVKNEQTNLRVVNMLGYDPAKSGDMDSFSSDVTSVILKSMSNGLDLDGGILALGMKYASSMKINTPVLRFQLAPTADPTVFRALFYAGVDKVNEEEVDQKLSYAPGLSDVKDVYKEGIDSYLDGEGKKVTEAFNKLKSNVSGKSGGAWSGEKDVSFALTGYFETEIYYDYDANRWECDFLNGDFTAGGGFGYQWTYNTTIGPVPVVAQFKLGATAQLNVKIASDKIENRTDFLTTLRIQAYFMAFGGIGFDYAVVALKIGLYGQLNFDAQLRWLSQLHGDTAYSYNIAIDGEVGILFAAKLLFVSYEKTLWSKKIPIADWKKNNWDAIEEYWKTVSSGRSGNQYQILSGTAHMLAFDQAAGVALYESPGVARLESRDYLGRHTRAWNSGNTFRFFSLDNPNGAPTSLQTNAYPYADPKLSDDGSVLLYLTDQDTADISATRVAASVRSGAGYLEGTILDDNGYGDSQISLAGTDSFAVAAWTRLSEDQVKKDSGSLITPDEQAMMLNATEVMASVYTGETWQTTALTSNTTADMAPVVVTNGSTAIVLWRSVVGNNNEDLLNFNAKDRIYYRVFNGSVWGEAKTLYNGTSGAVKGIDAVMASDGTTAVTYTIKTGSDDSVTKDLDIVYAIIGTDHEARRNVRLTADSFTNENPQLAAVKLSESDTDESFVLGWHSMQNADGIEKHDIRLAAFDKDGNLVTGFVDSLSDLIYNAQTNLTAHFAFTKNAKTIDELSIVWKEPALNHSEESAAEHDVLSALRFMTTDSGAVSVTAAQRLAEMGDETTIDSFDVYVTNGEIKAVVLGTTYDFSSLIQDGAVTDESGETTNIYLPETVSGLYTATMTYTDTIRVDSVIPDFQAIYRGGMVPIQFSLTNLGTKPVERLEITVGNQSSILEVGQLAPIAPGENRTVIVSYMVPDEALENADYTVKAQFAAGGENSATGTIALDIPDLGISVLELQDARDGMRYMRLGAYNESDSALFKNDRSVTIGLYTDAACTIPVDVAYFTPITVTGEELQLIDHATYMTQLVFDLAGYVKAAGNEDFLTTAGEVRSEGVTLYAKATVFAPDPSSGQPVQVGEYLTQNNTKSISFGSLLDTADGEAASITTTLEASEDKTDVMVTLQNNSINAAVNGNVIASLLSETGEVIAQKQIYTGNEASLLTLAPEEREFLTFSFAQAGASVIITYSQAVLTEDEAGLSVLSASEIPISLKDFVYDEDSDVYRAAVSVTDLPSTTITAVAKAADGRVSIGGKTEGLNSMSVHVPLTLGKTTVVSIQATSADGTAACDYELVIENHAGTQPDQPGSITYGNFVTPRTAVFDLYPKSANHTDVTITVTSDSAVRSVTMDGKTLIRDKDYTVAGNKYLFGKEFLMGCTVGTHRLGFAISGGMELVVTLTIENTGPADWQNPFTDVDPADWFYDAVKYTAENELLQGTSATTFAPGADMTRAMLVTVLYRLEGSPAVTATSSFTDVQPGQWYTNAVIWASAHKIVGGYGGGIFGTNDSITREQMATILYRYAAFKGYDTENAAELAKYADAAAISAWATDVMRWANAWQLITGTTDTTLSPTDTASRAEVATILMRFCENVVQ